MFTINLFEDIFTTVPKQLEFEYKGKPIEKLIDEDLKNAVIYVNGFQKDETYVLKDNDICTIRIAPSGFNLKAALTGTVIGFFTAGPIGALGGFFAGGWWWNSDYRKNFFKSLFGVENQQTNNTDIASTKTIPTLSGAKNQSGFDKPIPLHLGRNQLTPYFCGTPYHTIDGEDGKDQYYYALFMIGYNDVQVTDFKFGSRDLAHNRDYTDDEGSHTVQTVDNGMISINGRWNARDYDIHLELRQSANNDSGEYANQYGECFFYPQKVVEESLGIELIHTSDGKKILKLNRFSAKNPQKVQLEFTLQGLIGYTDNGEPKEKEVSIKAEISFDGGNTYTAFPQIVGANE